MSTIYGIASVLSLLFFDLSPLVAVALCVCGGAHACMWLFC